VRINRCWPVILRDSGLTLLEVLLVVAILGVLAATVAPGGAALVQSYRLKEAAEMVASDLRLVQQRAVAGEGSNWRITFNLGGDRHRYLVRQVVKGTSWVRELPTGIAFAGDINVGPWYNQVWFNLEGTPNSGAIDIIIPLVDERSGRRIFVKVAGTTGRVLVTERW
jgi:prepilin-type N-terminal cleavage/methylation domain-containing protein